MLRSSTSKSVLGLAIGLLLTGLAGCSTSEPTEEPAVPSSVQNKRVDADAISALAPGEFLTIDLSDNVVYHFDYSAAPIDYARVKLVNEDGTETIMEEAMKGVASFDYGTNPAVDLFATPDSRFKMGWDPSDMEKLTDSERLALEETGYMYKEISAPSQTQSEDNCIYAVCEVCPDGWGNGPCYYVNHVWCD